MEYNRGIVVDRIKSLIKASKKAHKEGITNTPPHTQEALAEKLGLTKRQIQYYLDKSPYGQNIPLDNLLKIAELYGCEIGYLLGEFEQPTRAAADITKETGLDSRAVSILSQRKNIPAFVDLINRIIIDSYPTQNKGAFPVNKICGYMIQIEEEKTAKAHPFYSVIKELLQNEYPLRVSGLTEMLQTEYPLTYKAMKESGRDISIKDFNNISRAVKFEENEKRNMRIDIQDLFSEFLRSDFIENYETKEGAENG